MYLPTPRSSRERWVASRSPGGRRAASESPRSLRSGDAKLAECQTKLAEGRGANLRDAAHREAEHRRDFLKLQLLEEVEREYRALLFLEQCNRLLQLTDLLLVVQDVVD